MFTRSIRFRLQVWQAFLLAVVLAGFGSTAFQLHRTNEFRRIDDALDRRVAALMRDLRLRVQPGRPPPEGDPRGIRHLRPPFNREPEDPPPSRRLEGPKPFRGMHGPGDEGFGVRPFRLTPETAALLETDATDGYPYAVWSRAGNLVAGSTNLPIALDRPLPMGSFSGIQRRTRNGLREAYQFTGLGECALVAADIRDDLAALRRFAWGLAAAGVAVLGLGLGGGWMLAARALKPVEDISTAATRIAEGRLSERIDIRETDSELGRLAGILNSTFARLDAAFSQQRQFTADASHELRTPIAVIVAEAQSALTRNRSETEYRESLAVCLDAAQQMRRLAQSLLDLARFDAGQVTLERVSFDFSDTVRETLDRVQPLARERGIQIAANLAPLPLTGDPERLARVVNNLLTNAIWYNRPEGRIDVSTRMEGAMAILTVADTGIGIQPEDLPHIFERFYRADRARGRSEGHHGLGLAICRAVVDAHAGDITVTSQPDVGTTFLVRLPGG